MSGLDAIFRPDSVAVIGASRRPGAVGRRILEALIDSDLAGPVYPINPEADHVGAHPAYPSIGAVGHPVDLAVVAVPAAVVPDVVNEAVEHGVRGLIVISAGFAEAGDEARQRRLLDLIADTGTRMIGPNCLGVINTDPRVRLNASFAPDAPRPGGVALCSQSGALGIAVIDSARRAGVGLRSVVSIGNAADVGVAEVLEEWGSDPDISAILLYLEAFDEPRTLARVAREIVGEKPIVAVKAGRTEAGSKAAASHTAAVSGADAAVDAILQEAGILRVRTVEQMLGVARFFECQHPPAGNRVGIVTNSGGPGILAADEATMSGMEVVDLSDGLRQRLAEALPEEASISNPVDMVASAGPEEYRRVISAMASSGEVDAVVAIYTEIEVADLSGIAEAVREGASKGTASVVSVVIGSGTCGPFFGEEGDRIPVYETPSDAVAVLDAALRNIDLSERDTGRPRHGEVDVASCREVISRHARSGDGWLGAVGSRRLLEAAGIEVAEFGVARDVEEAAEMGRKMDGSLAVSVISPDIVHKTDHGGVVLDVEGAEGCESAFAAIRRRIEGEGHRFNGVLVTPMLDGVEVLIGARREPGFGPLVAFGLGGVLVELLEDVAFRLAPLSEASAESMIEEIKGRPLLTGYRGRPPAETGALVDTLVRVADLAHSLPEIAELDLNPVFAGPERTVVADARVRIEDSAGGGDH